MGVYKYKSKILFKKKNKQSETRGWRDFIRLSNCMCSWVVFDFFEYSEQTDDEVDTIHYQPHPNQANKCSLIVAHPIAYTTFVAAQVHHRTLGSRELIVPCSG
jgi:hypothetical protein